MALQPEVPNLIAVAMFFSPCRLRRAQSPYCLTEPETASAAHVPGLWSDVVSEMQTTLQSPGKLGYYQSLLSMSRLWILAAGTLGPFPIWAAICVAARRNIFTPDSMYRVLRFWRWFTWAFAVLLLSLGVLLPPHTHWEYGVCASTFSLGLSFPESWLKRRLSSPQKGNHSNSPMTG
jgi:hypothetical protein